MTISRDPMGAAGLSPGRQAEACPTWDKLQVVQASEVRLRGHGRFLAAAAHNGAAGAILLLLAAAPLGAQNGWFQPSLLEKPEVHKAIQSVDDRATGIVDEWIRLVETPAPSGKEQVRAKLRESQRHRPAETRPASGDENAAALQQIALKHSPPPFGPLIVPSTL